MNLMKWFRKNNAKIMAVVVILLMIVFIMPSSIRQLAQRKSGARKTVAYFADNQKITNYDLFMARQELEILKMLRADLLLRGVGLPLLRRTQDLRAALFAELLFSERNISPMVIRRLKQLIRANNYRISDKQINDIYRQSAGPDVYWLLLAKEAEQAGIRISNQDSGQQLATAIPRLFNGATYAQLMQSIIERQRIPEEQMLTVFARLLAVVEYAKIICSGENVTSAQVMHEADFQQNTMDIELVKFSSSVFAENRPEPTQDQISAHFEKFKAFLPGAVSDENPYGFGCKQPDRVQLEYFALKLDDVSRIVRPPTSEEAERYYQQHREQFTTSVPSDPNDPNSPTISQTRSYAEVARYISDQLLRNRINSKTEEILDEAATLTEAGLGNADPQDITDEQFAQMAGDYKAAAERLSEKHNIKIYTGKTGMLSATDIQSDEQLSGLYVRAPGYYPVSLTQVVFALEPLKASELGPFDVTIPKMYENIGPVRDIRQQMQGNADTIIALVRVIKAQKSSEPESLDQTFSIKTLELAQPEEQAADDTYSVKEKVVEDLKKLAAMETTKAGAEEFTKLAAQDNWDGALNKFNQLYTQQSKQDNGDPNTFTLQSLTNVRRLSNNRIDTLAALDAGNPMQELLINDAKKQAQFLDRLYSLVPQDANSVDTLPLIMEFKPEASYYVIKNITINRLTQDQYEQVKAQRFYLENVAQFQSLAAAHFNPENILKRMNFAPVIDEQQAPDPNTPPESEGRS